MKSIQVLIRKIGNSQGVLIPKPLLVQAGLDGVVQMTVEDGALVLRPPERLVRSGWGEAAAAIAEHGDDELVMGEFGNASDADLKW